MNPLWGKDRSVVDRYFLNNTFNFHAFENYAFILNSPDYSWSYKWTMEDFLNRGLHKFVNEAQPFDNNKKEVKAVSNNPYANFSCGGE